ncbi:hypothetical protein D3C77_602140 [compost metagenome]
MPSAEESMSSSSVYASSLASRAARELTLATAAPIGNDQFIVKFFAGPRPILYVLTANAFHSGTLPEFLSSTRAWSKLVLANISSGLYEAFRCMEIWITVKKVAIADTPAATLAEVAIS